MNSYDFKAILQNGWHIISIDLIFQIIFVWFISNLQTCVVLPSTRTGTLSILHVHCWETKITPVVFFQMGQVLRNENLEIEQRRGHSCLLMKLVETTWSYQLH